MDFQQLSAFSALATSGNMSAAAEKLNTSQPQISKLISSLETELGLKLFDRIGRRVVLNENGRLFLEYSNSAMTSLLNGQLLMKSIANSLTGTLNIGSFAFAPAISDCVAAWLKNNPKVSLRYSTASNLENNPNALGDLDILLTSSRKGQYHMSLQFPVSRVIKLDRYYITFSKKLTGDELFQAEICPLKELCRYPIILTNSATSKMSSDGIVLRDVVRYTDISPHIIAYVTDLSLKMSLVEKGVGIALVPDACLETARKLAPDCRFAPITEFPSERSIILARRSRESMSVNALSFWEFVIKYYNLDPDNPREV